MTRRRFKEWEVIATLIEQGVEIRCFRCKLPLAAPTGPNQVQREHIHELALGGPDVPGNCRFSHADCHDIVTNGNGATSAGSSKHRIAKADRLAAIRLNTSDAVPSGFGVAGEYKPDLQTAYCARCKTEFDPDIGHRCQARSPWPKGRKIRSRGFRKAARP